MLNCVGYIGIVVLTLVLSLFLAVSIFFDLKFAQRKLNREKQKIEIVNKLISLDNRVQKEAASELNESVILSHYFGQANLILKNYSFKIEAVKITPLAKNSSMSETQKKQFIKAFNEASPFLKKEGMELSDILGSIYKLNHPLRYKFIEAKKNIGDRILLMLINVCLFLLKWLKKYSDRIEASKKSEVENQVNGIEAGRMSHSLFASL